MKPASPLGAADGAGLASLRDARGRFEPSVLPLLLLPLTALLPTPAHAQPLETIFTEANAAYFAGEYDTAAAGYERLVSAGVDDPDVAFNLATAHAKARRYGHAIRWYERALWLDPGDDDAEDGLAAARDALGRAQAARRGEALVETKPPFLESLVRPLRAGTLAWIVLVLDFLFFGAVVAFRAARGETARLALGIAAPIAFVMLGLATLGLAVRSGWLTDGADAVIVAEEAVLREGPDPRAVVRGRALEGERAEVVESAGGYSRVVLAGGRTGWIAEPEVGVIRDHGDRPD